MNDSLTTNYLDSVIGSFSFGKRLLVWDAYCCHTSEATQAHTKKIEATHCYNSWWVHQVYSNSICHMECILQEPDAYALRYWLADPAGHESLKEGT